MSVCYCEQALICVYEQAFADQLNLMLRRYYALLECVPDVYRGMLNPQLDELLDLIKPVRGLYLFLFVLFCSLCCDCAGLTTLTWMSLEH